MTWSPPTAGKCNNTVGKANTVKNSATATAFLKGPQASPDLFSTWCSLSAKAKTLSAIMLFLLSSYYSNIFSDSCSFLRMK